MPAAHLYRADQLLERSRDPAAAAELSPLTGHNLLLVDASTPSASVADHAHLVDWLGALNCPTLAVSTHANPLSMACDVHLTSLEHAAPLIANIDRQPLAASLLVQVLRAVPQLPVEAALTMESLAYSTLQGGPEFQRWHGAQPAGGAREEADAGPAVLLRREGDVLHLTLNRPCRRNAMSMDMRDALVDALNLALADDQVASVRVAARGKCFSTGGELDEFGSAPDPVSAHLVRRLALPGRLLAACGDRGQVHVHGACIGSGIEFPAFARRLVAAPDAYFQLPELRLGLIPGAGGCVSISRRIGRQRTAWMVLSGRRISAPTALAWGLVDAIEPLAMSAGHS